MSTNKNAILRLSRYRTVIKRMQREGEHRVFSTTLGDAIGVKSSQVRKDFSMFSITGNKKAGYQVDELLLKLNEILGKNEVQKVIIVGAGRIGTALREYRGFESDAIKILACFDDDETKQNPDAKIPVFPMKQMKAFVEANDIRIGILAVPENAAADVFQEMTKAGIKGILNFAPIRLSTNTGFVVNNVNLEVELENLCYFVREQETDAEMEPERTVTAALEPTPA